jgi:molecular chaperone DnaK
VVADPHAMTRLAEAVERAKIELSTREATRIHEPFLAGEGASAVNLDRELTRADVEAVTAPLLERTLACIDTAMATAGVAPSDLDRILLVGGASRMPLVERMVAERLDMPVRLAEDPDRAVAHGAALLAGRMAGADVDEVLVDITPFTLSAGVVVDGASDLVASPVIARSAVIPTEKTATYYTHVPDQEVVALPVTQGEAHLVDDNTLLGELRVEDLPASPPGSPVDVAFKLDLSGVLHVSATHRPSGRRATATIKHGPNRLTAQRRRAARERHEAMRDAATTEPRHQVLPELPKTSVDAQLRLARSLVRRAERALGGEEISDELRARIEDAADAVRRAMEAGEGPAVAERSEQLTDALYELG